MGRKGRQKSAPRYVTSSYRQQELTADLINLLPLRVHLPTCSSVRIVVRSTLKANLRRPLASRRELPSKEWSERLIIEEPFYHQSVQVPDETTIIFGQPCTSDPD